MSDISVYKNLNIIKSFNTGSKIINDNFITTADEIEANAKAIALETKNRINADDALTVRLNDEIVNRILNDNMILNTIELTGQFLKSEINLETINRISSFNTCNNSISGVSQSLSGYTSISQTNALSGLLTLNSTTKSISASLQNEIDTSNFEISLLSSIVTNSISAYNYSVVLNSLDSLVNESSYPIFDGFGVAGLNTTFTRASSAYDPINNSIVNLNTARVKSIDIGSHTIYAPLIEGARTNAFISSTDYSSIPWGVSQVSSIVTGQPDPFGGTLATTLIKGSAGDIRNQSNYPSFNNTMTASVYLKMAQSVVPDSALEVFTTFDSVVHKVTINALTGSFSVTNGTATVSAVGSYWRVSLTYTSPATGTDALMLYPVAGVDGTLGSATFFGTQWEAGSFPSTYIPTSGSPVTRAADLCTWTIGPQLAAGQGTLFTIGNDSTFKQDSLLLDSSSIAQASIRHLNASTIRTILNFNSLVDVTITPIAGQHTVAVTYDGSNRNIYYNGSLVTSSPNTAVAAGTTEYVGSASSAGYETFDYTTTLFFPRVLTPSEIQLLDFGVRNSSELNKQLLLPKVSIGYPNIIPDRIGQIYIDSNSKLSYIAVGLNKSDWRQFTY